VHITEYAEPIFGLCVTPRCQIERVKHLQNPVGLDRDIDFNAPGPKPRARSMRRLKNGKRSDLSP
jgi:hypothetical protein